MLIDPKSTKFSAMEERSSLALDGVPQMEISVIEWVDKIQHYEPVAWMGKEKRATN